MLVLYPKRGAGRDHSCVLRLQLEDLKQFRQWGSKTPGHPENFETLGIEVTTGARGACA